jgi:ubiquinone biosynthesis protein UbiJ
VPEIIIDPPLTDEQSELVSKLSEAELSNIDEALLSNISTQWRKVARVVGTTMSEQENRIKGIPDIFYAQRVAHLVQKGHIELQGNIEAMRFSEVRIAN